MYSSIFCLFFPIVTTQYPRTKNVCSHTCTWKHMSVEYHRWVNSFQISHELWYTQILRYFCHHVCGLDTLRFLLCSLSSAHITFSVFWLYMPLSVSMFLFSDTLVRILYDTCNTTFNVINFDYLSLRWFVLIRFLLWLPNPLALYHWRTSLSSRKFLPLNMVVFSLKLEQ